MKNARPVKDKASAADQGAVIVTPSQFLGTNNPCRLRVIQAALTRPLPREHLASVAATSNGPELVAELRRRGLHFPCNRTKKEDRDLFDCWPGAVTPKNDEAHGANAGQVATHKPNDRSDFATAIPDSKAFANIRAALALKGYMLLKMHDGTLLIERWGLSRTVDSLTQAAQFLAQIGGRP